MGKNFSGKYETGMMVYAWYIFDTGHKGVASIHWLDSSEDVARKGKYKQAKPA